MKKVILPVLIVLAIGLSIGFFINLKTAHASLTNWTESNDFTDPTGDVTGSCSDDYKTKLDLIKGGFTHDNTYLYFYWRIVGNGWTTDCSDSSFWVNIDVDNDGTYDYGADYANQSCLVDENMTVLYDATSDAWPPEALYTFTSQDYTASGDTVELRIPKSELDNLQDTIRIKLGVDPYYVGGSCKDESAEYTHYLGTTEPDPEPEPGSEVCDDDQDNDNDGKVDCGDSDCTSEEYCDQGLYVVKFKGRLTSLPYLGENNYWNADVLYLETFLDPKGLIQEAMQITGKDQFYLQGPSDRVENITLYPNDEIEVRGSFSYIGKDILFIHEIKLIQDQRISVTGRLLPVDQTAVTYFPYYTPLAKFKICNTDYEGFTVGDTIEIDIIPEAGITWPSDIKGQTSQTWSDQKAGDCYSVDVAQLKQTEDRKYLEVSPYRYAASDGQCSGCGEDCQTIETELSIEEKDINTEFIEAGESLTPQVTLNWDTENDLYIEEAYVKLEHSSDEIKKELKGVTMEKSDSLLTFEVMEIPEDVADGEYTFSLHLTYQDKNNTVCAIDPIRLKIRILKSVSPRLWAVLYPSTASYEATATDVTARLELTDAELNPLDNQEVKIFIPCEISQEACLGELEVGGTTNEQGMAEISFTLASPGSMGTHTLRAEFAAHEQYEGATDSPNFYFVDATELAEDEELTQLLEFAIKVDAGIRQVSTPIDNACKSLSFDLPTPHLGGLVSTDIDFKNSDLNALYACLQDKFIGMIDDLVEEKIEDASEEAIEIATEKLKKKLIEKVGEEGKEKLKKYLSFISVVGDGLCQVAKCGASEADEAGVDECLDSLWNLLSKLGYDQIDDIIQSAEFLAEKKEEIQENVQQMKTCFPSVYDYLYQKIADLGVDLDQIATMDFDWQELQKLQVDLDSMGKIDFDLDLLDKVGLPVEKLNELDIPLVDVSDVFSIKIDKNVLDKYFDGAKDWIDNGISLVMHEEGNDLDLHVIDIYDRHVGMNYETMEYESEIPGVRYSGDVQGAGEYIIIPNETAIAKVYVDARGAEEDVEDYELTAASVINGEDDSVSSVTQSIKKNQQLSHQVSSLGSQIDLSEGKAKTSWLIIILIIVGIIVLGAIITIIIIGIKHKKNTRSMDLGAGDQPPTTDSLSG